MFVRAIEVASEFTRSIHFVTRSYGSRVARPGAATLFMVNNEGWALTCKHVAEQLHVIEQVNATYARFKTDLATAPKGKSTKQWRRELARRAGFHDDSTVQMQGMLVNCADFKTVEIKLHSTLDVALIHFVGFSQLGCTSFPKFARTGSDLKQGKFICRLGFPFAEFENYEYDESADELRWNTRGRQDTPRFPIEGMVTRLLTDLGGRQIGFELSTPGLRGQSGGPALDVDGTVWGMQAATVHLDLCFDVEKEVVRNGLPTKVRDSAFLHVGHCVGVEELKEFMRSHGVAFSEAP